ncbi:MAG: 6-carboxytetrahydropterin synthase QueD [Ruminococcus sp.]|nr:6-carboxytetrahydropterin synthase QueD [Ruminococcus sp.]MBR6385706.1 6-carboxytetrahydropterin synthase QueD [Ruminococcus sp.]
MYCLKTSAAFDSAHFLSGYNGKCANIHGHHWIIEVVVRSENLQDSGEKRGMILDFGDLKKTVRSLADSFDHVLIYEKNSLKAKTIEALESENFRLKEVSFRPTAENFAKYFFDVLKSSDLPVKNVTVYETPENCAVYEE